MGERILAFSAAVYLFCGVIAFGHAAAEADRVAKVQQAECRASNSLYCGTPMPAINGAMAGLLWPLYLSWELFE